MFIGKITVTSDSTSSRNFASMGMSTELLYHYFPDFNGKIQFIQDFENFRKIEFLENLNQIVFLTIFKEAYQKNNPRFGFLAKFHVDMYVTKKNLGLISDLPMAFSVRF